MAFTIHELVAELALCVQSQDEEAKDDVCKLINGDAKPSQEAFDSLPREDQDLVTSECGFTRPVA